MHLFRICAVVELNVFSRNSLTEVCLKAVNAHIHQNFQLVLIPLISFRIGEVYDSHTCLPHIPLPRSAVFTLDEVALCSTFIIKVGFLSDIRIDPYADIQTLVFDTLQHTCRIGEYTVVPDKVTPVEFLHPVAVKVEGTKRNTSV